MSAPTPSPEDTPIDLPAESPTPPGGHIPDHFSPDDALPKVEPPSGRFILQLFVYPLVIVSVIVGAGLLINWVTRLGGDPHDYIDALERNNDARWQAAMNLANVLRSDHNQEFKSNSKQAARLAAVLDREMTLAGKGDKAVRLRMYLGRALGEFHVADGLPVMIKAASTQRFEQELKVRWFAFAGISKLVERMSSDPGFDEDEKLLQFLLKSLEDPEASIQWRAAFALGWYDDPRATAAMVQSLTTGGHVNVRYNAATALARRGDVRCEQVLRQMLDLESIITTIENPEETDLEEDELRKLADMQRYTIAKNSLVATIMLAKANKTADLTELEQSIRDLRDQDLESHFVYDASKYVIGLRELSDAALQAIADR